MVLTAINDCVLGLWSINPRFAVGFNQGKKPLWILLECNIKPSWELDAKTWCHAPKLSLVCWIALRPLWTALKDFRKRIQQSKIWYSGNLLWLFGDSSTAWIQLSLWCAGCIGKYHPKVQIRSSCSRRVSFEFSETSAKPGLKNMHRYAPVLAICDRTHLDLQMETHPLHRSRCSCCPYCSYCIWAVGAHKPLAAASHNGSVPSAPLEKLCLHDLQKPYKTKTQFFRSQV